MRMDREFEAAVFVTVGLELARRAGGFAVTGVAAQAVRGRGWQPQWRTLVGVGVPPVGSAAGQPGGRATAWVDSTGAALAVVEQRVTSEHHVLVVRKTGSVTATLWTERASCPRLASLAEWDALRLAEVACPWVTELSEAALARALDVALPSRDAGVAQQVLATSQICRRALERGAADGRWSTLRQVGERAGRAPRRVEEHFLHRGPEQIELF
ncbi:MULTISPECIES: hypothetical protein [Streptomyces]|uniref:hypothetical protein n=1 Tax=Streptomyces TaxID=1883 RepID=UPI0004CCE707|nr:MULTISPECIES: hypothetical protein [Streptomyces]KOT64394.1 hypothetical protein ADK43_06140 [Streptomyces rimosus subsp. rimosus]